MELTPEEDAIYQQLLTYYAMGDVATEDVEGYIYDGIRMSGTFEGTSKFADRIKELVDSAEELPDVDGETALERIGQKIEAVGPTLPPKPSVRDIQKKVAMRQGRDATRGLIGKLPASLAVEIGKRAATGKYEGGKKKTRKSKKTRQPRKLRKTRKYSRRR